MHVTCLAHRERHISIKLKIAVSTLLSRGAGSTTIVIMFNCYDERQMFELLPLIRGISGSNLYSQAECFDYVSREFLRSFWVHYCKTSLNNPVCFLCVRLWTNSALIDIQLHNIQSQVVRIWQDELSQTFHPENIPLVSFLSHQIIYLALSNQKLVSTDEITDVNKKQTCSVRNLPESLIALHKSGNRTNLLRFRF